MLETISKNQNLNQESNTEQNIESNSQDLSKNDPGNKLVIFMTLIASSFGVSSMGLSSICARSGVFLYIFQLILSAFINYCSYYVFLYLTCYYKLQSFQELSKLMLGKFQIIAILSLIIGNLGNMIGNLLIFIKYMQSMFQKMGLLDVEPGLHENMIQILIISIFLMPLILKRQLKDIFFVTYLTVIIVVFISFFVVYQLFENMPQYDQEKIQWWNSNGFVSNYSYLFFCYAGHQSVIIIYNENNLNGIQKMKKLMKSYFIFETIVFLLLGLFGYFTFFNSEQIQEVTYLALFQNSSSLVMFAQLSMLFTSIIAYIFLFKPTRDLIEDFLLKNVLNDKKENEFGFQNITVTVFLKSLIVSGIYFLMKYEISFITLVDNISELIVPWIFVILPTISYIKTTKDWKFFIVLGITFLFFSMTLHEKLETFIKQN